MRTKIKTPSSMKVGVFTHIKKFENYKKRSVLEYFLSIELNITKN